jgi:hypothetical protein
MQHSLLLILALLLLSLGVAPARAAATTLTPPNVAARAPAVKLLATQAGFQRVAGVTLAAAGLNIGALDPTRLQLRREGVEVALELVGTADGRLDPSDELRFFAPDPGDRWSASDVYWLTVGGAPGLRIGSRPANPAGAPLRDTAVERATWRDNRIYDSTQAGPDGDHWFAADLKSAPGQASATLAVPLSPTLPLATGATTFTVRGVAYTSGPRSLRLGLDALFFDVNSQGAGNWQHIVALPAVGQGLELALLPGAVPAGVEIDSVSYERPVSLNVGGRGAFFQGVGGRWSYRLSGRAAPQALYDLSDARAPARLLFDGEVFEDAGARPYLLSGPGTLFDASVQPFQPTEFAPTLTADALYIAPAEFHGALAPLLRHRQAQGYGVALVDVRAIYDGWGFGRPAPEPIRAFLKALANARGAPPLAVSLVGDGTSDPRNYTGRNNRNLIPPYLARVDPFAGETACETCFAQLDGDDPLDDPRPDLLLGRLPVKTADELAALVAKIVGYETAPAGLDWRTRLTVIADNGVEASGTVDLGGDFARFGDELLANRPTGMSVSRVYFDPWRRDPQGQPLAAGAQPWRIASPTQAYERTKAALGAGSGLLVYVGHSDFFRWAVTDPAQEPGVLLSLFDADALANGGRLPILLEMTCMTAAFQQPAVSGTTIDERLLLNPTGGVVAVWGPTGLGVAHGHDSLARGFLNALRAAPPGSAPVGRLIQAGYDELLANGTCCKDAVRTFALLGEPLMPARVSGAQQQFVPLALR